MLTIARLEEMAQKCLNRCNFEGWSRDWPEVSAYLGLECAEYVEAIRRRDKEGASSEAADILFVLLSSLAKEGIAVSSVIGNLSMVIFDDKDEVQEMTNETNPQ